MKRIFIIFSLLLALGVSAPFASASGSDSFDANKTLQANITSWLSGSGDLFFPMFVFGSDGYFDVTLINLNSDFGINPMSAGFMTVEATKLPGDTADLLGNFITPVAINSVQYFMLTGNDILSYEWNGNLINVVPGSIFMGINLGGAYAGMDVVLLLTPTVPNAVPVPAAVWLLGSGLAGLGLLRRKLS